MDHHVYRTARMGTGVLINGHWYYRVAACGAHGCLDQPVVSGESLHSTHGADDLAQIAAARTKIRFMFHAMATRLHSPRTLSRPRSRNWRNPSTDLMMPNTGSGVCLRKA